MRTFDQTRCAFGQMRKHLVKGAICQMRPTATPNRLDK